MPRCFHIKYTLIIWFSLSLCLFSQNDSIDLYLDHIFLNEVVLKSNYSTFNSKDFFLLKRRVLNVYPYIDSISKIIHKTDSVLKHVHSKRLSKRYSRRVQKKLISQFSENVMKLTRKEGVILSKLLYREFGVTAYELIKTYRGPFQAFFWQRLSSLYEGDLKSEFKANKDQEDVYIEFIINEYLEK